MDLGKLKATDYKFDKFVHLPRAQEAQEVVAKLLMHQSTGMIREGLWWKPPRGIERKKRRVRLRT